MSAGSAARMRLHLRAQATGDLDFVRADQRPDAEVHAFGMVVLGHHARLFGAELHACDVSQPHDGAVTLGDDQVGEFLRRAQVGVGEQVDLDEVALGLADGRQVVVALQGAVHVAGREPQRGQPVGVDPDTHRDLAPALDRHPLHAGQRRELRLQCAYQPVGDAGHGPLARGEADVERRVGPVGTLDIDARRFRGRGQLRPDLLQPRIHFGQRRGAAVVELQANRNRADARATARLDVVDAADRRYRSLDRRGQETAHGLRAGAVVDGRDDDRRTFELRILLHRQGQQCTPAQQHDGQVGHDGQHRVPYERIGNRAHVSNLLSGLSTRGRSPGRWRRRRARIRVT